ncbi:MAG: hypothetical protein DCF17_19435 [Shackletoniella antarctica]|uniref:DUF1830 domain-containing protein n=1 Tax=Shackletoniella antarctica TaxID=268115 RepID=A0A2W4VRJ1_9CYAN|nr:MAG: hypothetical protein DCF17_19435 [Shackletoniella antarctica]
MVYILSLLTSGSPTQTSPPMLCYHINNTCDTQNVRVMSEAMCHFERIVFAGERILFEAFPGSYLEIYSSRLEGTRMSRVACRLLRVNDEPGE